jgi:hypothetical protein
MESAFAPPLSESLWIARSSATSSDSQQRKGLPSATLDRFPNPGALVQLELVLAPEVAISHDVDVGAGNDMHEIHQKLQAVALAVDHRQAKQLAIEFIEATSQRLNVFAERQVISCRGMDDRDPVAIPVACVDQVDPTVMLVEVDELCGKSW